MRRYGLIKGNRGDWRTYMKNYHLLIQGDVVGVGFRSWMKREANILQIVGWVKNREDDTVEAVIQGKDNLVLTLLEKAKKGPEVSWVQDVVITENPVDRNLFAFEVIY